MRISLPQLALLAGSLCTTVTATDAVLPVNFGMVLFPTFQALDVFGPLDVLNMLATRHPINLYLLSTNLSPVSTASRSPSMNLHRSNFSESIVPTHTFATSPPLDVLIVPGGAGTRAPDLDPIREFIVEKFPEVKYLITICTGSALVASTGLLDGVSATGNKAAWKWVTDQGPRVHWVPRARWVVGAGGKVWTSSGIAAGIDALYAWVETVFGEEDAEWVQVRSEYNRERDGGNDPWAEYWNTTWPIVE